MGFNGYVNNTDFWADVTKWPFAEEFLRLKERNREGLDEALSRLQRGIELAYSWMKENQTDRLTRGPRGGGAITLKEVQQLEACVSRSNRTALDNSSQFEPKRENQKAHRCNFTNT